MPEFIQRLQLNSLIDWTAAFGMAMVLLHLHQQGKASLFASRSRYLFLNLLVFFLMRGLLWSWPSKTMDWAAYFPTATLPAAELLFVEGLRRRSWPNWARLGHFSICAIFFALNMLGWRQGMEGVEHAYTYFAIGTLVACAVTLATRDKASLSLSDNRFIDAVFLACVIIVPLAAGDFIGPDEGRARLGGVAALLLSFTLARIAGRLDAMRVLLMDYGSMALKIALIALCVQIAEQQGSLQSLGKIAALAAAFVLMLTMMGQHRILTLRQRQDSFMSWVGRLQTTNVEDFVAALHDFPLTQDHQVLRLAELEHFDRASIKACLAGERGLVSYADLVRNAVQKGPEGKNAAETARLLLAMGMSYAFRVHGEQGLYLLFKGDDLGGERYQMQKLELVQRMAASLEAHDLLVQRDEALRQSQKMEALGRLAGGVSHEFGNLLMVMRGYAQGLLKALGPDSVHADDAGEIVKATERASSLTRQLLAFSRRQKIQRELLDAGQILSGSEKMLTPLLPSGVQLRLQLPEAPLLVRADRTQLEQIVLNLVLNARDAMPRGGDLRIELGTESGFMKLTVSDTGHGMDTETRLRIFEPFFTTKPRGQGTGLGLPTVYGIVEQNHGRIEVKSSPGQGSSFEVQLPLAGPEAPHPGTCLVVDDEAGLRVLVGRALAEAGWKVTQADSGGSALEAARSMEVLDLLVTDLNMPGMDGLALARKLSGERSGLKILFMSANTNAGEISGKFGGKSHFLEKPFDDSELLEKVGEVMHG